ncbi:MAG TPA: hypothetical protein VH302_01280, partial [Bryobacteraceae bacterium]|nr:hypothetical protein [Bryobacteraceae bacterium]
EVTEAVDKIHAIRKQLDEMSSSNAQVAALQTKLTAIEGNLTRLMGPNPMFLPPKSLNIRLAALTIVVQGSDSAPTQQAYDVFSTLSSELAKNLSDLQSTANSVEALLHRE